MAVNQFTDINGKAITLDTQSHTDFCREFTVSTPKLSLRSVLIYTCIIWLLAYAVFFITEVSLTERDLRLVV